jgi:hypothetical protein
MEPITPEEREKLSENELASEKLKWNMKKFVETNDRYEFHFEDNEDAEIFQSLLRSAGFSAYNDPKIKPNWAIIVEKENVLHAFWREFGQLKSPDKLIDKSAKLTHSQAMMMLKKIQGKLNNYLVVADLYPETIVEIVEELDEVFE